MGASPRGGSAARVQYDPKAKVQQGFRITRQSLLGFCYGILFGAAVLAFLVPRGSSGGAEKIVSNTRPQPPAVVSPKERGGHEARSINAHSVVGLPSIPPPAKHRKAGNPMFEIMYSNVRNYESAINRYAAGWGSYWGLDSPQQRKNVLLTARIDGNWVGGFEACKDPETKLPMTCTIHHKPDHLAPPGTGVKISAPGGRAAFVYTVETTGRYRIFGTISNVGNTCKWRVAAGMSFNLNAASTYLSDAWTVVAEGVGSRSAGKFSHDMDLDAQTSVVFEIMSESGAPSQGNYASLEARPPPPPTLPRPAPPRAADGAAADGGALRGGLRGARGRGGEGDAAAAAGEVQRGDAVDGGGAEAAGAGAAVHPGADRPAAVGAEVVRGGARLPLRPRQGLRPGRRHHLLLQQGPRDERHAPPRPEARRGPRGHAQGAALLRRDQVRVGVPHGGHGRAPRRDVLPVLPPLPEPDDGAHVQVLLPLRARRAPHQALLARRRLRGDLRPQRLLAQGLRLPVRRRLRLHGLPHQRQRPLQARRRPLARLPPAGAILLQAAPVGALGGRVLGGDDGLRPLRVPLLPRGEQLALRAAHAAPDRVLDVRAEPLRLRVPPLGAHHRDAPRLPRPLQVLQLQGLVEPQRAPLLHVHAGAQGEPPEVRLGPPLAGLLLPVRLPLLAPRQPQRRHLNPVGEAAACLG